MTRWASKDTLDAWAKCMTACHDKGQEGAPPPSRERPEGVVHRGVQSGSDPRGQGRTADQGQRSARLHRSGGGPVLERASRCRRHRHAARDLPPTGARGCRRGGEHDRGVGLGERQAVGRRPGRRQGRDETAPRDVVLPPSRARRRRSPPPTRRGRPPSCTRRSCGTTGGPGRARTSSPRVLSSCDTATVPSAGGFSAATRRVGRTTGSSFSGM